MSEPKTQPKLRLRDPADILSVVPYLLGFHPSDSVVTLGLRGTRLVFHARSDLPAAERAGSEAADLADRLAMMLRTQRATGVLAIGYGEPSRVTSLLLPLAERLRAAGIAVPELLRVSDGRYWSYECQDPACCPPEGVPFDVTTSIVAAQATFAGCTALPDRAALVDTLAGPTGAALVAAERAALAATERLDATRGNRATGGRGKDGWAAEGRAFLTAAAERYAAGGRLTDDETAWLVALLATDRKLRDVAWERIDDRPAALETQVALWTDVVRRCHPASVVAPAVLLGYAFWRLGDGVRAGVAVDRALAVAPDSTPALLMAELLRAGVPPSVVDGLAQPGGRPRRARPRRGQGRRRDPCAG